MRPPAELYDDVEFITQGGMARVYRARRRSTGRIVAVREIPRGAGSEQRIASERDGAEIQRALSAIDRRVPRVYDVATSAAGWLYVEMELIEGEDLADRLQRGPLPVPEAVRIAGEIFDFLRVAHGQAVVVRGARREHQVHGDLTPRNVRLATDGSVRILDFGIAKGLEATATVQAFANYAYISPERARTGRMGMADDYWSAGVLLYEMLAGARAFPGSTEQIQNALAMRRPPLPLDTRIPAALRLIVRKLLAWDPAFRYPSAEAILEDLARFEAGRTTEAEKEEDAGRTRPVRAPVPPPLPGLSAAPAAPPPAPEALPGASAAPPAPPPAPEARTREMPRPVAANRRRVAWMRTSIAALALVIGLHEHAIWREADAQARIAATEHVPPDRLWSELEALRERAWLDVTTRRFSRVVAERLREQAVATLMDYREDVPIIRRPHFEAARALLARAARIDLDDATTEAWLRYAEGHLARLDAEGRRGADRRPALRQAVARFEEAARLAPHLPDPYIALARIYTYDIRDPDRARRAMHAAERLGHAPGLRGHAQRGDLFLGEGDALLRVARELSGTSREEPTLRRARGVLASAIEEYDKARGFGDSVRNARQAGAWIRTIDARLANLRVREAQPVHAAPDIPAARPLAGAPGADAANAPVLEDEPW